MTIWDSVQIILGVFVSIGALAIGLGYAYGKFKSGTDDALRQSNEDLRDLIKDQNETIGRLRKDITNQQNKISNLEGQIEILKKENHGYEYVIARALEMYFTKNPDAVKEIKLSLDGNA